MDTPRFDFEISPELRTAAPDYTLIAIEADGIVNAPTSDALWDLICAEMKAIATSTKMEEVRLRPAIDATRRAYKALGKEPNRYRPSAEALARRAVKGMDLYRTLTVIDLVNLVSLCTGISIGGFDADKIAGTRLVYGRGQAGEPYEAIGRGPLNIEGLPVWRDALGGIGTPTSDNERTKLTEETTRVLLTVNLYHKTTETEIQALSADISALLSIHAGAKTLRRIII